MQRESTVWTRCGFAHAIYQFCSAIRRSYSRYEPQSTESAVQLIEITSEKMLQEQGNAGVQVAVSAPAAESAPNCEVVSAKFCLHCTLGPCLIRISAKRRCCGHAAFHALDQSGCQRVDAKHVFANYARP